MASPFLPPSGSALATVDQSEGVQYENHVVEIEGVVSPEGQGGWPGMERNADGELTETNRYEVHCFALAAWRLLGQPLVMSKLTMLHPVPHRSSPDGPEHEMWERFPAYSVQRIRVLLEKQQTRAVVEQQLPVSPDPALLGFAENLRNPRVITTQRFGNLTLDPRLGWFEGKARWNWKLIDLRLSQDKEGRIDESLAIAETLWSEQRTWKKAVGKFAVAKLVQYQEDWQADRLNLPGWIVMSILGVRWFINLLLPLAIRGAWFRMRMRLTSISINENGDFTFWHNDGMMFEGHSIEVRGNLKDGLYDAAIIG